MNILALAASNSKNSINKQLVGYAASMLSSADIDMIDIHDYELPIFSVDREKELGQPALAQKLFKKIGTANGVMISYAEHNGSYTAAYKNLFDWMSRIDPKVYQNKPMLLLATSPGKGGASNVLAAASTSAPFFGGNVKATLSVPNFYDNFDVAAGALTNDDIQAQLREAISAFASALKT